MKRIKNTNGAYFGYTMETKKIFTNLASFFLKFYKTYQFWDPGIAERLSQLLLLQTSRFGVTVLSNSRSTEIIPVKLPDS